MALKTKHKTAPLPMLRPRSAPVIERAPLPIVEVQGRNHIVSYVNSAFCSLLEKPRKDLVGKSFRDIVPNGEECVPILDKVYETGEAVTLAKEDESELAHWLFAMWPALDEEERPAGVIIQLTKAVNFQQNVTEVNEALLIAGLRQHEMTEQAEHLNAQLLNEIAERKEAEKNLRESEERYRNLFNSIDEGFCIVEMIFDENENPLDHRFLEVNPSFEKQSGLHDVVGKRMHELVPEHEDHWIEIFGRVALTGEPARFVKEAKALQRWFDVYGFRIGGTESRKVAILFSDITERKRNETELQKSREKITHHAEELETQVVERTVQLEASIHSLENLNYTMAHDLRAPIRAMKGLTSILLEDFSLNEEGKSYAQKINVAAARMGQLVDDLLEYGELSHREFSLHPLNLKTEIADLLTENANEILEAHAEVQVRQPLPTVSGNKILLHQILNNLLLNAVKFVLPGTTPKILIHAETRGSMVRLWLEDNGIGISPQYKDKIFGVFQRLHSTQEYRGTGVGLAIVKRATERMGGLVGFESKAGEGSRFWIELPRA